MDAFVQLALIEKAKRVFAADSSVMLSFPLLAPMGFTAAELLALTVPSTPADYAAAGDFARIVNFLASDIVATSTERMLWDVYLDVLSRAEVGDITSDVVVEASAASLLYKAGPDGTRVESDSLMNYRQYRDEWFVAREDYAAQKLSGELSEDADERQHWTDVAEPALRAILDAATTVWETTGQRAAVEAAIQAERDATLRDPRRRWAEWKDAFNPDIDLVTDPGGQYAPTGLSPRNFADQDGWLTFDMSAGEMRTLVDEAPETLKRVLEDGGGTGLERVSFEYRSVALVRPWFRPEVLTSGIWRSSDPELILSDGKDPPVGACPAYASACVFVRNVVVTPQGAATTDNWDVRFTLDAARLTLRRDLRVDPSIKSRNARRILQAGAPEQVLAVTPIAFRALELNSFVKVASPLRVTPAAERIAIRHPLRLDAAVAADESIRIQREVLVTTAPVPEAPPLPPPTSPPRDEISILAFICKRLPRTPDSAPEPDLTSGPQHTRTHVVAQGDTLGKIAAKFYGSSSQWRKVYDANKEVIGRNPDVIHVGQKLVIP